MRRALCLLCIYLAVSFALADGRHIIAVGDTFDYDLVSSTRDGEQVKQQIGTGTVRFLPPNPQCPVRDTYAAVIPGSLTMRLRSAETEEYTTVCGVLLSVAESAMPQFYLLREENAFSPIIPTSTASLAGQQGGEGMRMPGETGNAPRRPAALYAVVPTSSVYATPTSTQIQSLSGANAGFRAENLGRQSMATPLGEIRCDHLRTTYRSQEPSRRFVVERWHSPELGYDVKFTLSMYSGPQLLGVPSVPYSQSIWNLRKYAWAE